MFLRIIAKLIKKKKSKLQEKDIIAFKENAWKGKNMADYYHDVVETDFFKNITANIFTRGIDIQSSILDVGAGTGRVSIAFAEKGYNVTALDISSNMLSKISESGFDIKTVQGSAFEMDFLDNSFDVVTSMDVDIHFPNWFALLKEKARVCKKGGLLIYSALSTENKEFLSSKEVNVDKDFFTADYSVFHSDQEIRTASKELGLVVESITPFNFLYNNSFLAFNMSRDEVNSFNKMYLKICANPYMMKFIRDFEEKVISSSDSCDCVTKIVRLRKL